MVQLVLPCLVVLVGVVPTAAFRKPQNALEVLERKLCGTWKGKGPCDGKLIILSNGTYKRELYGPGGNNDSGAWKLGWDALPPTLTLTCKETDAPGEIDAPWVWKVIQLDDDTLALKLNRLQPTVYERVMH